MLNSLAEHARLEPNDVIVGVKVIRNEMVIFDKRIKNSADFFEALNEAKSCDCIIFKELGGDGHGHLLQEEESKLDGWSIKVKDIS